MSGFFSRLLPRKLAKNQNSYRLGVETLEERCCPDGSHITLGAVVQPGHLVALTGTVTGSESAGLMVTFSGAVCGSTTTDSNGNFSYSTTNAGLGAVSAQGRSMTTSLMTDTAQAPVAVNAPAVTLKLASVSRNSVTLTGHLTDIDFAGQTVHFGGVAAGAATTDGNGDFSFTTTALALGSITATETDLWGRTSDTASTVLASNAPVIQNFAAIHGAGDLWTFRGHVVDENAAGLTVRFGGINSLTNQSVVVDENGDFSFVRAINEADLGGIASAVTTDWWGLNSATVRCVVG